MLFGRTLCRRLFPWLTFRHEKDVGDASTRSLIPRCSLLHVVTRQFLVSASPGIYINKLSAVVAATRLPTGLDYEVENIIEPAQSFVKICFTGMATPIHGASIRRAVMSDWFLKASLIYLSPRKTSFRIDCAYLYLSRPGFFAGLLQQRIVLFSWTPAEVTQVFSSMCFFVTRAGLFRKIKHSVPLCTYKLTEGKYSAVLYGSELLESNVINLLRD